MIRIATAHPYGDELADTHISIGKMSRIQNGSLLRIHSNPRTKYEGVTIVVGPCTIQRNQHNGTFDLRGEKVSNMLRRYYDIVLPICDKFTAPHKTPALSTDAIRIQHVAERTRWFAFDTVKRTYNPVTESYVDDKADGFAVVMTRGPWVHCSKMHVTNRWHLLEFVCLPSRTN